MVYCCVPHCGSEKGKAAGVSFHEFPSTDEVLKQEWIKNIARKHPVSGEFWIPNQRHAFYNSYIQCSRCCACIVMWTNNAWISDLIARY